MLFLCALQSSGGSGTIALSNAITTHVVTSAERGMYLEIPPWDQFGDFLPTKS
jgi:hypothetical protein